MDSYDTGRFLYLALLGAALVFWLLTKNKGQMMRRAQDAALWGLIFMGVLAVIGMWDHIKQTIRPTQYVSAGGGQIIVPRGPDGHYHLRIMVNGAPIEFIADTGASRVVLTRDDAHRAGIDTKNLAFISQAMTANGPVATAPVRLNEMRLGDAVQRDVHASVNSGEMRKSLLGMTYLQRFSKLEISQGQLILTP